MKECVLLVTVAVLSLHFSRALPSELISNMATGPHDNLLADTAEQGHNSAAVVGELWSLGSGGDDDVRSKMKGKGKDLASQKRAVLQRLKLANDVKRRAQVDGDAISLGVDQKLVSLPPCSCGKEQGWDIVRQAKAQVLAEEGEPAQQNVDCPCKPSVVGAVSEVLEEKLQQLQMELGSKTAASLALRKALVSMRLPSLLSNELVQELDSLDGLGDTSNSSSTACEDMSCAEDETGSEEGGGVHVTVNSYAPGYAENMTSRQPYYDSYQYPASYLSRPQKTTVDSDQGSGSGKGVTNVVVNVNNNYYMSPPAPVPSCHPYCHTLYKGQKQTSSLHTARAAPPQHASPQDHAAHAQKHASSVQHHAKTLSAAHGVSAATESRQVYAAGSKARGSVSEAEKAQVLANKIAAAAKQTSLQNEHEETEEEQGKAREGVGHNGEEWEAARRRLVDTALKLERIARQRADALRRSIAEHEAATMAAPTEDLAEVRSQHAGDATPSPPGPRGAKPVASPIAAVLNVPVDEADKAPGVTVPVVHDKQPKPQIKGMLQRMGVLGINDRDARSDLSSYFDASAARHGGTAAHEGGGVEKGRGQRKGTRAAADGAGLLQESDSDARGDLMAYFDRSSAEHSGRRHGKGKRGAGLAEVSDHSARNDLMSFFDTLSASSKQYTRAEEERAKHNKVRGTRDSAARKQLMGYFDNEAAQSKMYTKEEEKKGHP